MPSGMAAQVRELLATSDKTGLVLQRAPLGSSSKTGFVNVIGNCTGHTVPRAHACALGTLYN